MPIRQHSSIPNIVISVHVPKFTQFMKVKAGEIVTVGKEDDEYPGWVWCTDAGGISNWVPKALLKTTSLPREAVGDLTGSNETPTFAEFVEDYDATEMAVQVGELVTVYAERSGWLWCENARREQGWIPKECVGGMF